MKTKLIFVRHGEATGNIDKIFHGVTDSELTANGREQIERVAARLAEEPIDYIYSSGLKRAHQTALAIAAPHGLSVTVDPRFREIDGGRWEKELWGDLPKLFPESYDIWLNEPWAVQMPEGDSMVGFFKRLREGVEDILKKHPGKTVCVATHGTAVRVLCCYCKNKPLEELNEIMWCDNAAVTVAEFDDETGFSVIVDGDNSHLADISTINEQDWWKID